jgi:hypothetical protein
VKQSTIFAASVLWRRKPASMLVTDPEIELLPDGQPGPRRFKIKTVDSDDRRRLVDQLLSTRYGWRGYKEVQLPTDRSVFKFSLAAVEDEVTIGSITVSFDGGPEGLTADQTFRDKVDELRSQGRRVCEFVRLAVDPTVGTKRVLAALFHIAYIVAHRVRRYDMLLIEVNPRHVAYYRRMLGFKVVAPERPNASVNAPAVLLGVDFEYVKAQIGEFAGQPERMSVERSLYPASFSLHEEAAIIARMLEKQDMLDRKRAAGGAGPGPGQRPPTPPSDFYPSDILS